MKSLLYIHIIISVNYILDNNLHEFERSNKQGKVPMLISSHYIGISTGFDQAENSGVTIDVSVFVSTNFTRMAQVSDGAAVSI